MSRSNAIAAVVMAWLAGTAVNLRAGDSYESSLKAGDSQLTAQAYDSALSEYDAALLQAANETERALALSKKAYILAFGKKDYASARDLAETALAIGNVQPVGQVTALQVLAECQMVSGNDYASAAITLEKATALTGVDWAMPALLLSLGDAYRLSGNFDEAMTVLQRLVDMPSADAGLKAVAHLNMGLTHQYGYQNPAMARAEYEKAVVLKPDLQSEINTHLAKLQ